MNNGSDRFNLRLPPKETDLRCSTPEPYRLKPRPPPRPFSAGPSPPFVTNERRPVSNSSVETKTFAELSALLRTSSRNRTEMHPPASQRGVTSAGNINRRVLSHAEAPHREVMRVDVEKSVKKEEEPTPDSARVTRTKRMSGPQMLFLGSKNNSRPRSTLQESGFHDHDEVDLQPVHHELRQRVGQSNEERCDDSSSENVDSNSSCESNGADENRADDGADMIKLMNLYESLSIAEKIPQQVDAIVEEWSDRHHKMNRRLSKSSFRVSKLRVEIERAEEAHENVRKLYDESRGECNKLSMQCTKLEEIVREEKEKNGKQLQELRERISREISSKTSKERECEKLREELKYLQSHYEKEVSRREMLEKERDSAHEELSREKTSFGDKEREYKSRISLEEAKVSELSSYNDSMIQKARNLEKTLSESQNTVEILRTEANVSRTMASVFHFVERGLNLIAAFLRAVVSKCNLQLNVGLLGQNVFAMLNSVHEWYKSPRRHDSVSLSLEALVQHLCQLRDIDGGNNTVPEIAELSLPVSVKSSETPTNLQTELGTVLDLFRSLVQVFGKREDALSRLVKDLLDNRRRLEGIVTEPQRLIQPVLAHIETTKANVKDELTALQSERETVSKTLAGWREKLDEARLSCQGLLSQSKEDISRIRADQTREKEQNERNKQRVEELESELQQQLKLKEELSKKSHDLEVCRTVLAETRKDFAKARQDAECLKISMEQKDLQINQLKSILELQKEKRQTENSGHENFEQIPRYREDECEQATQRELGKMRKTSVAKQAHSSRLKLDRRTIVNSAKQVSTATNRGKAEKSVRNPDIVENDVEDESVEDDEDWFEDQETTRALAGRDIHNPGEKGRLSVRIPPRFEAKTRKSNTAVEHSRTGKKRQDLKSSFEAPKSKRFRGKHI